MKKAIGFIICVCFVLSLSGCAGPKWDRVREPRYNMTFSAEGESRTFSSQEHSTGILGMTDDISGIPSNYTEYEDPYFQGCYSLIKGSWMTVEVTRRYGETPVELTITVERNDTGKERTGHITLDINVPPYRGTLNIVQLAE